MPICRSLCGQGLAWGASQQGGPGFSRASATWAEPAGFGCLGANRVDGRAAGNPLLGFTGLQAVLASLLVNLGQDLGECLLYVGCLQCRRLNERQLFFLAEAL